jgi:hypothetical protein
METNQAMQMYASEGRTPTKDTSFLGTTQAIGADILAASNQFIQTNIQAAISVAQQAFGAGGALFQESGQLFTEGAGLLGAGATYIGEGLSFETQGATELQNAAQTQTQLDTNFSNTMAAAFGAVGNALGMAAGGPGGFAKNLFGPSTPTAPTTH